MGNQNQSVLEFTGTCKLVSTKSLWGDDLELEYIEHSQDQWHSNENTCITIDKEKAIEIINFLKNHFEI